MTHQQFITALRNFVLHNYPSQRAFVRDLNATVGQEVLDYTEFTHHLNDTPMSAKSYAMYHLFMTLKNISDDI